MYVQFIFSIVPHRKGGESISEALCKDVYEW